jgi:hypothetical protein
LIVSPSSFTFNSATFTFLAAAQVALGRSFLVTFIFSCLSTADCLGLTVLHSFTTASLLDIYRTNVTLRTQLINTDLRQHIAHAVFIVPTLFYSILFSIWLLTILFNHHPSLNHLEPRPRSQAVSHSGFRLPKQPVNRFRCLFKLVINHRSGYTTTLSLRRVPTGNVLDSRFQP